MNRTKALGSILFAVILALSVVPVVAVQASQVPYGDEAVDKLNEALDMASPQTRTCISCHAQYTPTIVYDWLRSQHAWMTPDKVLDLYEKMGVEGEQLADKFSEYEYTIGCYECHGMFADQERPDVINHNGFQITTIVTAKDCAQCHPKEAREMSWTWHTFASFNAFLKPWYAKVVSYAVENDKVDEMLPPVYEKVGSDMVTWEWWKGYVTKILNGQLDDEEVQQFGTIYDQDFKNIISPLYPASGTLNTTVMPKLGFTATFAGQTYSNIMEHPLFKNGYVYHACAQCHGSAVIPYAKKTVTASGMQIERVEYWGWPSNGAGRIDPDGSMTNCAACHVRHEFSLELVRKPETCGQCHLGYDHPHIEIYEESKHGNIYSSLGEAWNWTDMPWKAGVDFNAPTCATCHMSTIADPNGNIVIHGTHDLRARLVWDQMHFFSFPKPKWPDHTQNAKIKGGNQLTGAGLLENHVAFEGYTIVTDGVPESGELAFPRVYKIEYTGDLAEHRNTMKAVCELCHSSEWTDNYFLTFDQNIIDYNITATYIKTILNDAWARGIHDPTNKLDEYIELMWYYVWHHDGRRWRNGAAMMGPDFAHWFGVVDTVMDKVGRAIAYYQAAVERQELQQKLETLAAMGEGEGGGAPTEVILQIQDRINELDARLAAMEAEIPALKSGINDVKAQIEQLGESVDEAASMAQQAQQTAQQAQQAAQQAQSEASNAASAAQEAAASAGGLAGNVMAALGLAVIAIIIAIAAVAIRKK